MFIRSCILLGLLCLLPLQVLAEEKTDTQSAPPSGADFADLSIEELLNIRVTSVSKKEEKASDAPSAIYVITQEDIRRSGVTSIADALRMAPGLNVSQITSHEWAVSSRGFQGALANKLLVLMDGRSVYTPLFSGVYWDVQDTLLEDIDRIEVIRGPGATVWGANAVNGVINIITKKAQDTKGGLVTASAGTAERTIDSIRFGGKIGEKSAYRIFAKYADRAEFRSSHDGQDGEDGSLIGRAGARVDYQITDDDSLTFVGDYYRGKFDERRITATLSPPFAERRKDDAGISGGSALLRWDHSFSDTSETTLQAYYDRTVREEIRLDQSIDTIDIDFTHRLNLPRNDVVYGLGYRNVHIDLDGTFAVSFLPSNRRTDTYSAFVQNEIEILRNKLYLTLGSKFEYSTYTGFEVQPSVRVLGRPAQGHTLWASVSRAVRTASPAETDIRGNLIAAQPLGFPAPVLVSLLPTKKIPSETVIAHELGYRVQPLKTLSLDFAGFYNRYDNLRSNEAGAPFLEDTPAPSHFTLPIRQRPFVTGEAYGGELSAVWQALPNLRLDVGYSYLKLLLHANDRSIAPDAESGEGVSPQHQFHVRACTDLPHNLQFDVAAYYQDQREALNVPSYVRLDARLGWRPLDNMDISITGQNLLRRDHQEFNPDASRIERNLYLKVTFKF